MALRGGDKMVVKLGRIARNATTGKVLRVGFPSDALYPDGTPVAMIAAAQNYGTETIPPRPFFSNMVDEHKGEWAREMRDMRELNYDANEMLAELGDIIADQLWESVQDGDFAPLAEATVAKKGHDQPLIDKKIMLAAITWWLE